MYKFTRIVSAISIGIFILAACNLPSSAPATDEPNVVFTAAALTVQAQMSQAAPFNTPTLPPPAPTNTPFTLPTALPTATTVAAPTASCDLAQFVKDVTIPDGSTFAPGASFTKTWRLKNVGTCTWSGYSLVFDSGDAMNGTTTTIGTVAPGQEIDLSVTLTAPTTVGSYKGFWRIRNASGVLIPVLSGTQGKSFFVDIKVGISSSGFDLYTRAGAATWASAAGVLTFGGPDTNPNGFAMYRNDQKVEGGTTPAKAVETHPQWVNDGYITGLYPSYTVVTGERFRAKIGFILKADGSCGVGNAKFRLEYKEAGVIKTFSEWTETCDGTLREVDVDLSSLAGKTVQFALTVAANGTADQDWAVWIGPRVELP